MVVHEEDYLAHYGVKGMKWGKRKARVADESSDNRNKKSRKKALAVAGVIAGTAAVSIGAYYFKKYKDMNADAILNKNIELQHLAKTAIENFDKPFYATYLKSDKKKYLNPNSIGFDKNWKLNQTVGTNKNIKVAGTKSAVNVFKEFVQNNDAYKERFGNVNVNDKKAIKRAYDMFIKEAPPAIGSNDRKLANDFFKKLTDSGYDAIRDTYDQKLMKVKSPIIVFNNLSELMTVKVEDLK